MFYRSLLRFVVSRPRMVIAAALLLTAILCLFIPRIRLRLDGRSLIPAGEESLRAGDEAAAAFGLNDIVVICFVAPNGMNNAVGLERIGRVSAELKRIDGIDSNSVMSLTTLPLISAENGIVDPAPPVGDRKVDDATLARVGREVRELGLDNGILASRDGSAAAIYAFVRRDADREGVLDNVEEMAALHGGDGIDIHIGGNALAQAELGRSVALDLMLLVPILLVLLVILITAVFRSYHVALVSLTEIGLSLLWTIGAIGLFDQPVFITTLILPVVLIAIGVSDDIYAVNRYISMRRKGGDISNEDAIVEAFASVWKPILLTALTSMAGLASLAIASLEPLRVFGIFGALSLGLSTLFTFTVVPAILALRPLALREKSALANRRLAKISVGLLKRIEKAGVRRVVYGAVVLGAAAAVISLGIHVDDSWVQNLAPSSAVAKGDVAINEHLGGSTTVEFAIESAGGAGFLDPAALRVLASIEEELRELPRVGAVQSAYADILRILAVLRRMPYDEYRKGVAEGRIELTGEEIERAILIDQTLARPQLGSYLAAENGTARLTAFVHGANYERLKPVFEAAQKVVAAEGKGMTITPFGDGWISYLTVRLLVEGQIYSIATAALANLLLVAFMLRSFRTALVSVLPVVIGVLFTFAVLVLFDITLGIASSMFASIALGIGIDYSIHLAAETKEEGKYSPNLRVALRRAFASTGPSIIVSSGVITSGFAVLLLSSVVPNRMLGLLVCISLTICGIMTLVLVPGLAEIFKLGRFSRAAESSRIDIEKNGDAAVIEWGELAAEVERVPN